MPAPRAVPAAGRSAAPAPAPHPTLYVIRHCESEANRVGVLASRLDYPLSPAGAADAEAIARTFARRFAVNRIICSPLARAVATAEPIALRLGLAVEIDPALVEQDLGVFAGATYDELAGRADYEHDRAKRWEWRPSGGESYRDVYVRVAPFLANSVFGSPGQSVLCVTHAVTMRLIRAYLEASAPRYPLEIAGNGEVWEVALLAPGASHVVITHDLLDSRRPPARE